MIRTLLALLTMSKNSMNFSERKIGKQHMNGGGRHFGKICQKSFILISLKKKDQIGDCRILRYFLLRHMIQIRPLLYVSSLNFLVQRLYIQRYGGIKKMTFGNVT